MNGFNWITCSRSDYMDALNVVPPTHQEGGMFLVGEPVDHEGAWKHCRNFARFKVYRYLADEQLGEFYWVGSHPITKPAFYCLASTGDCENIP